MGSPSEQLKDKVYYTRMILDDDAEIKESGWYEENPTHVGMSVGMSGYGKMFVVGFPGSVRRVQLPDGLEVIDQLSNSYIEEIELPESLKILNIYNAPKLKEIYLPLGIKEVGLDSHVTIKNLDTIMKFGSDPDIELL